MRLPSPHPRVLARRLQQEMVLVHLDSNQIYTLNETGARFWELLGESTDPHVVEAALCREFDVSADEVRDEMNRLVGELTELDLLR